MHKPVLLEETVSMLITKKRGIYIDCTVGGGGHLALLAERLDEEAVLVGIDKDMEVLDKIRQRMAGLPVKVMLIHGDFRHLTTILKLNGIDRVDGILLDLGVSSFQLDTPGRGFSYHLDARLDMRMDKKQNLTAWHLVNELPEEELASLIRRYGEERFSRSIARNIVKRRQAGPINTTLELAETVKGAVPPRARKDKHPARRTFQALRIAVNDELDALEEVLPQAVEALKPGGRIVVITFHSLEDRIVKNFFKLESSDCLCPPSSPVCICKHRARLKLITKRPVTPKPGEQLNNPRSRSAKLRVAEKLD